MTLYQMRLHPRPFNKIRDGVKTVEIRLNDDKRQLLKVGDHIEFISREDPTQKLLAEITELSHFATFKELFYSLPPESYGAASADEYESMYEHYSKEDEGQYGVVAIGFRLV